MTNFRPFPLFQELAEPFSGDHGQTLNTNRDWKTAIAAVGSTTKWCVPPTA